MLLEGARHLNVRQRLGGPPLRPEVARVLVQRLQLGPRRHDGSDQILRQVAREAPHLSGLAPIALGFSARLLQQLGHGRDIAVPLGLQFSQRGLDV